MIPVSRGHEFQPRAMRELGRTWEILYSAKGRILITVQMIHSSCSTGGSDCSLPSAVARGQILVRRRGFGGRALFCTHRLLLLKIMGLFQTGFSSKSPFVWKGETTLFWERSWDGDARVKRELLTSGNCGNVTCRQLLAFPAWGVERLLFHIVWSSLISILLIIF